MILALVAGSAPGQYPSVPPELQREADAAKAAADKLSDEAFARALPVIEEWAKKGRPYVPGASKPSDLPQAKIPAFPGAWGGGMYTMGGRGGRVFVVTNLADSGPGTFREACEAGGPRIVVFNVAGIVRLKDRIRIRAPYITIDGSSAPGDGVCIAGNTVELETHDVIIRHMRFRRGITNVADRNDSLGGNPVGNIIIDHVSASWGLDENLSMYRHMYDHDGDPRTPALKLPTVNITIQNCLMSEALNTYNHAFGSTIGGLNSTFHHNVWACNTGRNPSVGMYGDFTFVNNVLFNWRHRTVDGGDHMSYFNIISNYYKPGPATPKNEPVAHRILKPEARRVRPPVDEFGVAFVVGNVVEGNPRVTSNNWDGGIQIASIAPPETILPRIRTNAPYSHAPLFVHTAMDAFHFALANVGATLPRRDAVDQRIIEMLRTGRPTYGEGIITDVGQVGGYPEYKGEPYKDSDNDGMPDAWELANRLDPSDPSDASADANGDGYTNIECFLYGLNPRAKPPIDWTDLRNNFDRRDIHQWPFTLITNPGVQYRP